MEYAQWWSQTLSPVPFAFPGFILKKQEQVVAIGGSQNQGKYPFFPKVMKLFKSQILGKTWRQVAPMN